MYWSIYNKFSSIEWLHVSWNKGDLYKVRSRKLIDRVDVSVVKLILLWRLLRLVRNVFTSQIKCLCQDYNNFINVP